VIHGHPSIGQIKDARSVARLIAEGKGRETLIAEELPTPANSVARSGIKINGQRALQLISRVCSRCLPINAIVPYKTRNRSRIRIEQRHGLGAQASGWDLVDDA